MFWPNILLLLLLLLFLVVVVVPGCCLLFLVGACWCLLVLVGACWCLLVPVGACWCLLFVCVVGVSCETPAVLGPPRFQGPGASNTTEIPRKDPPRERRKNENCGGRGKQKSENLGGPAEGRSSGGAVRRRAVRRRTVRKRAVRRRGLEHTHHTHNNTQQHKNTRKTQQHTTTHAKHNNTQPKHTHTHTTHTPMSFFVPNSVFYFVPNVCFFCPATGFGGVQGFFGVQDSRDFSGEGEGFFFLNFFFGRRGEVCFLLGKGGGFFLGRRGRGEGLGERVMSLQVVQFQYCLEFLRLSYSEFVQSFQDYHQVGFSS